MLFWENTGNKRKNKHALDIKIKFSAIVHVSKIVDQEGFWTIRKINLFSNPFWYKQIYLGTILWTTYLDLRMYSAAF